MRRLNAGRCRRARAVGLAAVTLLVSTTLATTLTTTSATADARTDDNLTHPRKSAISVAEADSPRLLASARRIATKLGEARTAGVYLDRAGALVVAVADTAAATIVTGEGAKARQVPFSTADLNRAQTSLDTYARAHGAGSVRGWYVDVPDNTLTVSVDPGSRDAATRGFLRHARTFGKRVHVVEAPGRTATAASLYDGQGVQLTNREQCSNGFNATAGGHHIFLTAGHCAVGWPAASRAGVRIGGTRGYSYPINDYAAINDDYPDYWHPQGAVDMHNGYARPVYGQRTPPVGATVCKSGDASGWTCGVIQAYNQTVNYGNGQLVYGLVRHTACVEPGDSGGSTLWGNYAAGITSGGQFYRTARGPGCGQRVGLPNTSFYQPVDEALDAFDATLTTY